MGRHSKDYVFKQYENKQQFVTIQSFDPFGNAYAAPFDTSATYRFEYLGLENLTDSNVTDCAYDDNATPPVILSPMNGSILFAATSQSSTQSIAFYIQST